MRSASCFAHPTGSLRTSADIPLLRGMNDGNRMWRAGPRLRRAAVFLLLALRAIERPIRAQGGVHRARRIGPRKAGVAPPVCGVPPSRRAGVREAAREDRAVRRFDGRTGVAY